MVQDYQENYGKGWISLYRSIKDHWVWSDPIKLKWWLSVLFEVNHTDNKVAIGYNVIECKRGQSLKSLRTWATEFECGTKAATKFFDMLEKDGMITRETIGKGKHSTTLLTVCNYDTYQSKKVDKETLDATQGKRKGDTKETQGKRKGHTNNNDNNANNENNENKHRLVLWIEENAPSVNKLKEPFTFEECERLKEEFDKDFIIEILTSMHNYKPLLSKNVNANLTFRNWANRDERYKKWREAKGLIEITMNT
jgi:hypothetical protein